MERRQDWPSQLDQAIHAALARAAAWGAFDCCLFAADCVHAMTDVDPAEAWRGRYRDRRGAVALLAEAGGVAAIAGNVLGELGAPEIAPALAQRGDVVAFDGHGPDRRPCEALGVVSLDARFIAAPAPDRGLVMLPRELATRAWRI